LGKTKLTPNQAYDGLWDDVSRQFLSQTDPILLSAAISALNTLSANLSLATNNAAKALELTEALFNSLRDALDGQDVGDLQLNDEQVAGLEAIMLRLSLLERSRDLVDVMEDTEGGQSSGWDIVCEFVSRGDVGYKEESKVSSSTFSCGTSSWV
jgi:cohesin complex subunit SA-1/2